MSELLVPERLLTHGSVRGNSRAVALHPARLAQLPGVALEESMSVTAGWGAVLQ
jgi:hypothetical protein